MEKISEIIRMRLKEAGVRYNSNDNISDFVKEGERMSSFRKFVPAVVAEARRSAQNSLRIGRTYEFCGSGR